MHHGNLEKGDTSLWSERYIAASEKSTMVENPQNKGNYGMSGTTKRGLVASA
jgi:hypothetical protein